MGMVGTMIGLVAMLKTMDDLGSIGDAYDCAFNNYVGCYLRVCVL